MYGYVLANWILIWKAKKLIKVVKIFLVCHVKQVPYVTRREEKGTIQKYRKCSKTEEDRTANF